MIRVLLIEDNPGDVRLVREMLSMKGGEEFALDVAGRLHEALEKLATERFEAILLDLGLPDAQGPHVVEAVLEAAPEIPIVVLSGQKDEMLAVKAVRRGAQDYLVKGLDSAPILTRALHYAIERKRSELRIQRLANHDGLTDLPNRRLFLDRLGHAIARSRRQASMLALLFVDLDRFKEVNDLLGHAVGDQLLIGVAQRLLSCTRESDTVARLGGDEFCLLVPDISRLEDVGTVADKVLEALDAPFAIEGREIKTSASIGISAYPRDGEDADVLLRSADAAMYGAKQDGRGQRRYASSHSGAAVSGVSFASPDCLGTDGRRLREALENEEFVLHYQPLLDVSSGRAVGVEALVRWQHPTLGVLAPASFLPLADRTGLIVPLGEWVPRLKACRQLQRGDAKGDDLRPAVNLSRRQLGDGRTLSAVRRAIAETETRSDHLQLPTSPRPQSSPTKGRRRRRSALRDEGVRLAGRLRSGGVLSELPRYAPLDEVKINRSSQNVATAEDDAATSRP
jgi:diguanylate cyclase (GGDEF)-like protein